MIVKKKEGPISGTNIAMLLVVCVVFVIFLYLGVTAWAWIRYDEPRVVTYKDSEQALNSLISDLKRSRRTAEVIAERCNLDLAPADSHRETDIGSS